MIASPNSGDAGTTGETPALLERLAPAHKRLPENVIEFGGDVVSFLDQRRQRTSGGHFILAASGRERQTASNGMKLPNGHRAVVVVEKLRDYCLSPVHEEGKHKARVFAAALGLDAADASWLRDVLLAEARERDCQLGRQTVHGQRYLIDFNLSRYGKSARLRSVWNIRPGEDYPRLVTCYVL